MMEKPTNDDVGSLWRVGSANGRKMRDLDDRSTKQSGRAIGGIPLGSVNLDRVQLRRDLVLTM